LDSIYIHIILLSLIIISSIFAVSYARVIRGAIILGIVSMLVSISLFLLSCPLAGIFELSVCSGLITVIFISVISLTVPPDDNQRKANSISMIKKIILLFLLVLVCGFALYMLDSKNITFIPLMQDIQEPIGTRDNIWNLRHVDLIGQALILLTGLFAVVVLFKKDKNKDKK